MADAAVVTYGITGSNTWDVGGGTSGQYSGSVIDLLQNGINLYSQYRNNQLEMDYRRWEAQNGILTEAGSESDITVNATTPAGSAAFKTSSTTLLILGAVALWFFVGRK